MIVLRIADAAHVARGAASACKILGEHDVQPVVRIERAVEGRIKDRIPDRRGQRRSFWEVEALRGAASGGWIIRTALRLGNVIRSDLVVDLEGEIVGDREAEGQPASVGLLIERPLGDRGILVLIGIDPEGNMLTEEVRIGEGYAVLLLFRTIANRDAELLAAAEEVLFV